MTRHRYTALIILSIAGAAHAAEGQQRVTPTKDWEVQIFLDNDKWAKSDRHYTNGIKLGFGINANRIPGEAQTAKALNLFTAQLGCDPRPGLRGGLFIGQNMYTPRDVDIATAQSFDRPWAAWLYAGVVLQAHRDCGNRQALDTVELDIGFVGPIAQGEEIQNWWHRVINVPESRGWANQIPNEPAFLLNYVHKQKFKAGAFEIIPHVGAAAGTVMTFARTGALIRVGHNMTGFGPDRIEPGGAMLQNFRTSERCKTWRPCEAYVFAGTDLRAVAYNIFLDGTVFRDSPSVDRKVLVYDLSVGLSVRFGVIRLTAGRVTRSEEFTTPLRGGGRQTFHSLNVGFEF